MLLDVVLRSIWISGTATSLAVFFGLPLAALIGLRNFWGKRLLRAIFNALLGIPTVALGLILFILFSRGGPLGPLGLLYTPWAMIIGQAILIAPIVISFMASALESVDPEIKDLARTLGATERQTLLAILSEAKKGVILSIVAAFNRAISELGVAMMVGGNIYGYTRVITTTIALEAARGEIRLCFELAIILMAIVFGLTLFVNVLRGD